MKSIHVPDSKRNFRHFVCGFVKVCAASDPPRRCRPNCASDRSAAAAGWLLGNGVAAPDGARSRKSNTHLIPCARWRVVRHIPATNRTADTLRPSRSAIPARVRVRACQREIKITLPTRAISSGRNAGDGAIEVLGGF